MSRWPGLVSVLKYTVSPGTGAPFFPVTVAVSVKSGSANGESDRRAGVAVIVVGL
jgi:hypothetical protein